MHEHSPEEIIIYRNGVKYGRSLAAAPPLPEQPQGEPPGSRCPTCGDPWKARSAHSSHGCAPAAAPATAQFDECICDEPVPWCPVHSPTKASSSISVSESAEPVPAVGASVDLRNRALAYLALAEKATPGPWAADDQFKGDPRGTYPVAHCGCESSGDRDAEVVAPVQDYCKPAEDDAAFIAASHEAAAIIRAFLTGHGATSASGETSKPAAQIKPESFASAVASESVAVPVAGRAPVAQSGESFEAWLCYAYGESDRPSARFCRTLDDLRAFLVDEWFGDPKDPELDGLMEELNGRDWSDEPWKVEFEIGGVTIDKVGAWQASATAPIADEARDAAPYPRELLLQAAKFYENCPTGQYDEEAAWALRVAAERGETK